MLNSANINHLMSTTTNKKLDISLLAKVIALAKPYRWIFIFAAALAVILAPLSVLRPRLVTVMVDDYIFKYDMEGLGRVAMLLVVLLLVEFVLEYAFQYSTSWLGQSVVRDLRVRVFKHITSLRLTFFDKTPVGVSTTRTISDIEAINQIFAEGVITMIADMLTVIAVIAMMLYTSWKLTLVCMLTLPLLLLASYVFQKKVRAAFQIVRTQIAAMNAFLQERITGMRTVQIFHAEQQEANKFKAINHEYTRANLKSVFYYAIFFPVVDVIAAASLGLMVWYGARGVIGSDVTLGALVAFPIYINMLFRPIRMLADKFNTLQMGLVASERVFGILEQTDRIENTGTIKPERFRGEVEFEQVWFSYNEKDFVLKDVSFKIDPGKTLAIVGSTGSGKTTIINLLNRFYDIQKGHIKIDGTDVREYDLYAMRRHIALVLQDVFLFSGSVLENITMRDSHITREQVIEAAKMIGAHEFIMRLPGDYDYQVMERGATLSMGQRQLISFVRALVFDPNILILDEATSSIDPESESIIQYAIEKLIAKRTSIIIAHRLTTIRHANNILVLHKGEVQEYGSHEELLKNEDGHYRQLYEMQFLQMAEA